MRLQLLVWYKILQNRSCVCVRPELSQNEISQINIITTTVALSCPRNFDTWSRFNRSRLFNEFSVVVGGMAVHLGQEQDNFRGICACIAEFLQYEHLEGSLEVYHHARMLGQPFMFRYVQLTQFCAHTAGF